MTFHPLSALELNVSTRFSEFSVASDHWSQTLRKYFKAAPTFEGQKTVELVEIFQHCLQRICSASEGSRNILRQLYLIQFILLVWSFYQRQNKKKLLAPADTVSTALRERLDGRKLENNSQSMTWLTQIQSPDTGEDSHWRLERERWPSLQQNMFIQSVWEANATLFWRQAPLLLSDLNQFNISSQFSLFSLMTEVWRQCWMMTNCYTLTLSSLVSPDLDKCWDYCFRTIFVSTKYCLQNCLFGNHDPKHRLYCRLLPIVNCLW